MTAMTAVARATSGSSSLGRRAGLASLGLCLSWGMGPGVGLAHAQFQAPPAVSRKLVAPPSKALSADDYRIDAARHLYAAYAKQVKRGPMPHWLHSVMIVATQIDSQGQIVNLSVLRKPAVEAVEPWVLSMIRNAAPFPAPEGLAGDAVVYTDIWLVDKWGVFQLDTLTEGQR